MLAIDPGSAKCGIAVVLDRGPDQPPRTLYREIAARERVVARVLALLPEFEPSVVVIGNATGGAPVLRAIRDAVPDHLRVEPVEEAFTSQRARQRFQIECPPRGLARLIPPGFRTPPRAYDDYVAVLLAEDFLTASREPPK